MVMLVFRVVPERELAGRYQRFGRPYGLSLQPLAGGSFCSFRAQMRGFCDLLREQIFSLFMLLWLSSVSITFLMIQSMCLDHLARLLVLCNFMQWPKHMLGSAIADTWHIRMVVMDVPVVLFDPSLNLKYSFSSVHCSTLAADAMHARCF